MKAKYEIFLHFGVCVSVCLNGHTKLEEQIKGAVTKPLSAVTAAIAKIPM